jgi:uncharacterized protein (DUF58 family)
MLFTAVLGAMLLGAINYNNNLGFLLTFLLGSLALTALMHTYGMLYGLRLESAAADPTFAGSPMEVTVTVAAIDRRRTGVRWYFHSKDRVEEAIEPGLRHQVVVPVIPARRGFYHPGWLRIASEYPLGLFQAWARIDTGLQCLVYPRPMAAPTRATESTSKDGNGNRSRGRGVDDFQGLSAYQPGDSPRRIHWQAYSRGRGLHTKTFAGQVGVERMLDLATIQAMDTEAKLSILCFQVLQAHRQQRIYGLKLGAQTIAAGSGRFHRDRCLRALALFGQA